MKDIVGIGRGSRWADRLGTIAVMLWWVLAATGLLL
jgi:hypothetical protein